MSEAYYVFADCQSLFGGCLGNKFSTQNEMDDFLRAKGRCHIEGSKNLPLYTIGIDIDMYFDELYTTQLSQNDHCCWYYVMKTQKQSKPGRGPNEFDVPVDPEMWKKVYSK